MTQLTTDHSVSVVIATHNRRTILARALDALAGQTYAGFEVIVIDDGSTDGTSRWLQSRAASGGLPRLRALRQEHGGQGVARNRGLELVDDGLVILMGDDILLRPDAIARHIEAHQRLRDPDEAAPGCAVVGFTDWCRDQVEVTPLLEMINREGHQFGYAHMTPGEEVPFTCFYSSNISLWRRALGDEPFDPSFTEYGWEDIELGYRLSQRGMRLVFEPSAAAEHLHQMSLRTVWQRQRLVGRGAWKLLQLHPELEDSPLLTPSVPPWWFVVGRRLVPPAVPMLELLDRARVPMPKLVLHNVLMCAYYLGVEESRRSPGAVEGAVQ